MKWARIDAERAVPVLKKKHYAHLGLDKKSVFGPILCWNTRKLSDL